MSRTRPASSGMNTSQPTKGVTGLGTRGNLSGQRFRRFLVEGIRRAPLAEVVDCRQHRNDGAQQRPQALRRQPVWIGLAASPREMAATTDRAERASRCPPAQSVWAYLRWPPGREILPRECFGVDRSEAMTLNGAPQRVQKSAAGRLDAAQCGHSTDEGAAESSSASSGKRGESGSGSMRAGRCSEEAVAGDRLAPEVHRAGADDRSVLRVNAFQRREESLR